MPLLGKLALEGALEKLGQTVRGETETSGAVTVARHHELSLPADLAEVVGEIGLERERRKTARHDEDAAEEPRSKKKTVPRWPCPELPCDGHGGFPAGLRGHRAEATLPHVAQRPIRYFQGDHMGHEQT